MTDYNGIEITNVDFRPWNKGSGSLVAFADVQLNKTITLSGFRIIRRKDGGLFAAPPSTKKVVDGEDRWYDQILFPQEWREEKKNPFCDQIVAMYKDQGDKPKNNSQGEGMPF